MPTTCSMPRPRPQLPPVRLRYVRRLGFPRRRKWMRAFTVAVFAREPMAVRP